MFQKWNTIPQILRLPAVCPLCQNTHYSKHAICKDCFTQLPQLEDPCPQCAMPHSAGGLCGKCLKHPPLTERVWIAYPFIEPLRSLIHTFKYEKGLYLTSFLSQLILEAARNAPQPECLIPVPLHPKRLYERGFNQACLLTQKLSKTLKLPSDFTSCKKIKYTLPQANLKADSRKENLSASFYIHPLPYQHVALIDDVYTTGSTVNAITKILKTQGVRRVDVWCVARTL